MILSIKANQQLIGSKSEKPNSNIPPNMTDQEQDCWEKMANICP